MTLAMDLYAFYLEHRRCGELEDRSTGHGAPVVLTCSCGAVFNRVVDAWEPPAPRPRAVLG